MSKNSSKRARTQSRIRHKGYQKQVPLNGSQYLNRKAKRTAKKKRSMQATLARQKKANDAAADAVAHLFR